MRWLLGLSLGGLLASFALAEPPPKISEVDHLRHLLAQAQARAAQLEAQLVEAQLTCRYQIEEGDTVDPKTLVIARAKKEPQKAAK